LFELRCPLRVESGQARATAIGQKRTAPLDYGDGIRCLTRTLPFWCLRAADRRATAVERRRGSLIAAARLRSARGIRRCAGHLVTKDDLLERVWPVMMVEEAALHVQVSTLRKVYAEAIVAVHTADLTGCSIEPAQPRGPVPCTLPRAIIAN